MKTVLTRRDGALIVSIVVMTVTSMWAGIQFVDAKFADHRQHAHPGAISQREFEVHQQLIIERLNSIDRQLESIRATIER